MGWLYRFFLLLMTVVLGLELTERDMTRLQPPTQRVLLAQLLQPQPPPPPPPPPPVPADPLGAFP